MRACARPTSRRVNAVRRCCSASCLIGVAGLLSGGLAGAADWGVDADINGQFEHHGNPLLLDGNRDTISGVGAAIAAVISRQTEISSLQLTPRVYSVRYDGAPDFDRDEQYLDASYKVTSERHSWLAGAGIARDTTLTSELEGTGLIASRKRHELDTLSVAFTTDPTRRDELQMQASYQHNRYLDAQFTGLVDYDYATALCSYVRSVSERQTFGAELTAGQLTPAQSGGVSRDYSARLTFSSRPSSQWLLNLAAGVDRTLAADRNDTGTVFDGGLVYSGELTDLHLTAEGGVAPSGSGALIHRAEYAISMNRRLSSSVDSTFSVRHVVADDLRFGSTREHRSYQRAAATIDWHAAEHWRLSAMLAYSRQAFGGQPYDAHGIEGSLGVAWSMPRWSVAH
jgi:hypothetical protein